MKTPRGTSESSTTSDNTTEFIDIVKKYDVVYNTHNPDYKNVEVKLKVWSQIAEEIGLSIDASKRKWKNLRDSYTKYLRSFRTGTKTSKKYQYWAHAEHMEFLKPYQGPGRNPSGGSVKVSEDDENECDLGYQVLAKATNSTEDDVKVTITSTPSITTQTVAAIPPIQCSVQPNTFISPSINTITSLSNTFTTASSAMVLPIPSLPAVPLPPQLSVKTNVTSLATLPGAIPPQIFPLPQFTNNTKNNIQMPSSSTASSVGCLILEPQLFASIDTFKKELGTPAISLFTNLPTQATSGAVRNSSNTAATKIRRVQPSPQTAAINLSCSATTSSTNQALPPTKIRKLTDRNDQVDIGAILQANRDLDANTLFFLSLARTVRLMPTKFQSLAKMRCMRIVSDIELELENADNNGLQTEENGKFCNADTPPNNNANPQTNNANESGTEHFVYCMSPSRLENMIDISSDEENGLAAS